LIEEKAWTELVAHTERMADKIMRLEKQLCLPSSAEWIDSSDVCQWLGISKRTLQYYRERGKIPYTNIGKKCYYKTEDIRALLEKGSTGKNK